MIMFQRMFLIVASARDVSAAQTRLVQVQKQDNIIAITTPITQHLIASLKVS